MPSEVAGPGRRSCKFTQQHTSLTGESRAPKIAQTAIGERGPKWWLLRTDSDNKMKLSRHYVNTHHLMRHPHKFYCLIYEFQYGHPFYSTTAHSMCLLIIKNFKWGQLTLIPEYTTQQHIGFTWTQLKDVKDSSDMNHVLKLIPPIILLKCHQHNTHNNLLHDLFCVSLL